ncbi:MAG: family 43 glycosylhydrolase, partial [Rubrobacteraceae bacterium]
MLITFFIVLVLSLTSGGAIAQNDSYTNPVSKDFADTFADPAVIKAKDGYWYAFGTTDPLREGEREFHTIPISRSDDLVNWEYVGDAFDEPTEVPWAADDASIWAPDIRYLDGKYYMYYVVTQTTETDERDDNAIGVATAPTPAGPWTDSGEPVVGPRRGNGGFLWTFDPNEFTDSDGTKYLYYGSYNGGVFVTELSDDGERAVGEPTMVAIDNRYEGTYIVKRDGFYYLFASSANCCAGPTTGYSVYVGRAESPRGPFLDKEGQSMTESRVGGSIVVTPNGNKWIGPGHNAVVTDLSGEDWFAYHALDRADPYLDEPFGINERPMLIDRLDWIDGWPTVRAGQWASEDEEVAPVTDWIAGSDFNDGVKLDKDWRREGVARGAWRLDDEEDAGGYVRQQSSSPKEAYLVSRKEAPTDVRAEADLRIPAKPKAGKGAAGLLVAYEDSKNHVVAWLDKEKNSLVTDVRVRGRSLGETSTPLPEGFRLDEWHNVAVEVQGSEMTVEVTDARLHDPVAFQERALPPGAAGPGSVGVASRGARAEADNVGAAELYEPKTEMAPKPEVGDVEAAFSDEFNDGELDEAWTWVREDPDALETAGAFRWPTQAADLDGTGNDAGVLLRDPPEGDY